jgi:aldose 1-epimerase
MRKWIHCLAVAQILSVAALLGGRVNVLARPTEKIAFGKTPDGQNIDLYTLTNKNGMEVAITNFGGIVVRIRVADRHGKAEDVVLGYDSLDAYVSDKAYFGAIVGRYGNRIAQGKFTLDGAAHALARNNGENSLHGGIKGFNKAVWEAREVAAKNGPSVELTYTSKDGEEGYPGNLSVKVVYTLTERNELKIDYSATTDKNTVLNLTNHSYFNLNPAGSDILQHMLMIEADRFTPVDAGLIPTGELKSVAGTPFDFRKETAIGARIEQDDEQLKLGKGYDHNFVLNKKGEGVELAARVVEPTSGRVLEVLTDQPGVQFYSGNFLDGTVRGKGGKVYQQRSAFCLETQHFPDSPNHPKFPTTELKPGEKYHSTTIYKFSAQ